MGKHTPGPWFYNGDEGNNTARSGFNINTADHILAELPDDDLPSQTLEANARLMAAAPELYTLLKEIFDAGILDPTPPDSANSLHTEAKALIAKAEGR